MDSASYQQQETPRLCARGCGFCGNSATQNLCSKCYKDYLKEEEEASKSAVPSTNPFPCFRHGCEANNTSSSSAENPSTIKINRCDCCKKKVGLTGFGCRCGGMFCGIHRYPEKHACKFDFKTQGRDSLAEENPLIIADKLDNRLL